jgi:hypothetical protein
MPFGAAQGRLCWRAVGYRFLEDGTSGGPAFTRSTKLTTGGRATLRTVARPACLAEAQARRSYQGEVAAIRAKADDGRVGSMPTCGKFHPCLIRRFLVAGRTRLRGHRPDAGGPTYSSSLVADARTLPPWTCTLLKIACFISFIIDGFSMRYCFDASRPWPTRLPL